MQGSTSALLRAGFTASRSINRDRADQADDHRHLPHPLLPYRITICSLINWRTPRKAGSSHVVSILDPEAADPELSRLCAHRRVLWPFDDTVEQRAGLPRRRRSATSARSARWARRTARRRRRSQLLITAMPTVSRSTATAVILGSGADDPVTRGRGAVRELARVVPRSWPNSLMVGIADTILGGSWGALVRELREARPRQGARGASDLAAIMRCTAGRGGSVSSYLSRFSMSSTAAGTDQGAASE